jgi:hypothetical protein
MRNNRGELFMKKIIFGMLLVSILVSGINARMIRIDSRNIVYDSEKNIFWQDDPDSVNIQKNWNDAVKYCSDLKLSGYSDWKLPDADNNTLFDLINQTDEFKFFSTSIYWSSNESSDKEDAWSVNFQSQTASKNNKNNIYNTKCIRNLLNNDISLLPADVSKIIKEELLIKQSSEKDELDWKIEHNEHTVNAYKNYLNMHPNGIYAEEARDKIKYFDQDAYNTASSQNTIASYKEYLKQYPNGEYASSARSDIQYIEEENRFRALLQSKSPQIMYIEAGKQERNGNTSKANQLYEAIIDRFPNSDFAVKASDKMTGSIRAERAESNRRSQSRQECENNKNACLAGCGTYISDAPDHNLAVYQCNDKCKQISCY